MGFVSLGRFLERLSKCQVSLQQWPLVFVALGPDHSLSSAGGKPILRRDALVVRHALDGDDLGVMT